MELSVILTIEHCKLFSEIRYWC